MSLFKKIQYILFLIISILIFPLSRKFILNKLLSKLNTNRKKNEDFIEGDFEDIEENDDRKI